MTAQRLVACLFIWLQSYLVWDASRSPAVPVFACIAAVVACLFPQRITVSGRWWGGILLGTTACAIGKNWLWPHALEIGDWVVPAAATIVLAECLLLIQTLVMFRRFSGDVLPEYFASLSITTFLCTFNRRILQQEQESFLVWAIAMMVITAAFLQLTRDARPVARMRADWKRRIWYTAVMCVAVIGAWQFADQFSSNVGIIQDWSFNTVALGVSRNRSSAAYARFANLESVAQEKVNDPMGVALRVFSNRTPGYLRGRAFAIYSDGQWQPWPRRSRVQSVRPGFHVIGVMPKPPPGIPRPSNEQNLFEIVTNSSGPLVSLEVWNDPNRGTVFFTPLETTHVQGDGTLLRLDYHGVIRSGVSTRRPYTVYATRDSQVEPLPTDMASILLTRPRGLDPRVDELARELSQGRTTTRQRINAVTSFFQDNFTYSLEQVEREPDAEPLSHFLLARPPAHCEYFASGAVALLRSQGIPCRYVTGYVVQEQSEYQNYWMARNKDAHAWVEAYDQERQKWVTVEATPGMSLTDGSAADDQLNAAGGDGTQLTEVFALAPMLLEARWRRVWLQAVGDLVKGPLTLAAACAVVLFVLRQAVRSWLQRQRRQTDKRLAEFHRHLRLMDRRLGGYALTRGSTETLHQFAERIRQISGAAGDHGPWLRKAADWYVAYATQRCRNAGRHGEAQTPELPPIPA